MTSVRGSSNNGPGDKTPDDDLLFEEANKILNLVLWSPSSAVLNNASGFSMTKRTLQTKNKKIKKSRRPKSTIFRSAFQVLRSPPGYPSTVVDGLAMNPRMTMWYHVYIKHPQVDNERFQALFRRRFRVPHSSFLSMNIEMNNCPQFTRWHNSKQDCCGVRASPISMLHLSVLRYLGRSWTIDCLHEATCISEEVIRNFIHQFLEYGSTVLYDQLVTSPTTMREAQSHVKEYEAAGFPGAVGSTDATHVLLERVNNRNRQGHLGFKSSHTARAYNITVNHRRQILSTTSGHPARWNDKTLQLFDPFMEQLHEGKILDDLVFQLYSLDAEGSVVKTNYQGGWLLVDNGYLSRSTTVPPIKTTTSRSEIRFSAWLESLRKDVECTFGILKGRWRILKSGIRLHGTSNPDKVFRTCCALHNLLLDVDGLNKEWNNGVPSDYATMTLVDDDEVAGAADDIPTALQRLASPAASRDNGIAAPTEQQDHNAGAPVAPIAAVMEFDNNNANHDNEFDDENNDNDNNTDSRDNDNNNNDMDNDNGRDNDNDNDNDNNEDNNTNNDDNDANNEIVASICAGILPSDHNEEGADEVNRHVDFGHDAIKVRNLSLTDFRSRLVVHFNIAFNRNEVEWPRRMGHCKELHSIQML